MFKNAIARAQFQEDFKIPFAGYRHNNARIHGIEGYANLWSSSPAVDDKYARYFDLVPNVAQAYNDNYRAGASSIRCIKDLPMWTVEIFNITYNLVG